MKIILLTTFIAFFTAASVVQKGFFSQQRTPELQTLPCCIATVLFAGDAMFDRHIRQNAEKNGYEKIFEEMKGVFQSVDEVVLNLEGPITNNASVSVNSTVGGPNNYTFTFDPQISSLLKSSNIHTVNLGNNHILNYGKDGLQQTLTALEQHQVSYFGNTGVPNIANRYMIKEISGVKIGFVNYNQFVDNGYAAAIEDLREIKEDAEFVVVFAHWGAEYLPVANGEIQALGHGLIDEGADLVIGTHPHVVQQREEYNGKTIYYSLGNFVFDQYFSNETMHGLTVHAEFDAKRHSIKLIEYPVTMNRDGTTMPTK